MRKLGEKQLRLRLTKKLDAIPKQLTVHDLALTESGDELIYSFDTKGERTGITALLEDLKAASITFNDLDTTQSSLEDIFVGLVRQKK
jgi:ABC-2 type transport system ATP-binding protein